jgi:hypothetical protein
MEQQQFSNGERFIQRRASSDVMERRAAKTLVSGIQPKLDGWHRRVAFLKAMALVAPLEHRAIQEEAGEQMALVIATRINLESEIASAMQPAARHSLIRDVLRSLRQLQAELEQLVWCAGGRTEGELASLTETSPDRILALEPKA